MESTYEIREQSYNAIHAIYKKVLAKIKQLQGNKGYIDTQDNPIYPKDTMYFYGYTDLMNYQTAEGQIVGVRAVEDRIEILGYQASPFYKITFDESSFKKASDNYDNDEETDDWESCWQPIDGNEFILLVPTLFSIAEVIEEYGTEE